MKKSNLLYLMGLLAFSGCLEQVDIDPTHEPQIVIAGVLGQGNSNFGLEIVWTTPLRENSLDPVNNAQVALHTRHPDGTTQLVTNEFLATNGEYQSAESVQTIFGNSYWIEVSLPDGTTYVSSEEKLLRPVVIKDLRIQEGNTRVIFSDPPNEANQYVVFASYFAGVGLVTEEVVASTDVLFNGNQDAFIEIYVNAGDNVSVDLAHLGAASYQFFLNVQRQSEDNDGFDEEIGDPGQLFRQPPVQLYGNIKNRETGERVLGNFTVVSFSEATADI